MRWSLFLLSASMLAVPAAAAPRLDPLFGDHAVLQRDRPILVTGTAAPGETVVVSLVGSHETQASPDGRFAAPLPPMAAGGPLILVATSASAAARRSDALVR